ncbi:MAG TPA: ABC transporter substrate-binding protein [Anaerolineae bacterium]|nr:ABC transporter substrate-binding protein [Anaerolineae bacterium]
MAHTHQMRIVISGSLIAMFFLVGACTQATTAVVESTSSLPLEEAPPTQVSVPTAIQEPTLEPISFTDGFGREVSIAEPAQRVVSIAPSSTEILFAVGASSQVVGRDEYSDYPPEAIEVTSIGSTYGDLNLEAIIALEPDLVFAAIINSPEHVQALEDLGIVVCVLPNPMGMEELYEVLEMTGRLTGHENEAEDLVDQLEIRVETVTQALTGAEPVPIFYEVDGTDPNAPWTTGPGTFQDVLISLAGGENIAKDIELWGQLSLEEIVARDPEVIVFSAGPWVTTTPESIAERAGWGEITAVVHGAIYGIDTNWIDRPGPRYVDALEALAMILHPELFE